MQEKDMYDFWKSRMELYMMNRQHGRMILDSVENGPLIWPSIDENGVTRPKKYSELSATEAIQADCDVKATNIILQGLPPEVYVLVSNHKVAKELWERIQLLMQGTSLTKQEREYPLALVATYQMTQSSYQTHQHPYQHTQFQPQVSSFQSSQYVSPYLSQQYSHTLSSTPLSITYPSNDFHSSVHHNVYTPSSSIPQVEYSLSINQQPIFSQPDSGLIVPVFQKGNDPIDVLNHMMSFLTVVVTSRDRFLWLLVHQEHTHQEQVERDESWFKDKLLLLQAQANGQILHEEELAFLADPGLLKLKPHRMSSPTMLLIKSMILDAYDSDCDEINTAKVAQLANLSHYGSNDLAEVHNQDNVTHNLINQAVQAMPLFEQSSIIVTTVNFTNFK
nr:hypothetical protein [Tanacetum cinerariifolium]